MHERDSGERLERPVVEEEGEAAPLVLLGGDELCREAFALGLARAASRAPASAARRLRRAETISAAPARPDQPGGDERLAAVSASR